VKAIDESFELPQSLLRRSQSNMAIGPHQIGSASLESCILCRATPPENVNREAKIITGCFEGFLYLTVYMHLPIQRA